MFSTRSFAVALTVFSATTALATDCTRQYTIKEGDTCDSISAANSVSTYQLAVVNNGLIDSTCSNLMPGGTLCLGCGGEDCTTTYVVKENDTCDCIIADHGLNSTLLYANNPQINEACDNIYIGEVLCVSGSVQAPPAPSSGIPATTIPSTATPASPPATKTPVAAPPPPPPSVTTTPAPPPPSTTKTAAAQAPSPDHGNNDDNGDDEDNGDNEDNGDDEGDDDLPDCDED